MDTLRSLQLCAVHQPRFLWNAIFFALARRSWMERQSRHSAQAPSPQRPLGIVVPTSSTVPMVLGALDYSSRQPPRYASASHGFICIAPYYRARVHARHADWIIKEEMPHPVETDWTKASGLVNPRSDWPVRCSLKHSLRLLWIKEWSQMWFKGTSPFCTVTIASSQKLADKTQCRLFVLLYH